MKKHYYKEEIASICESGHKTIEEIYETVSQLHPRASRSSIYRNINDMVSMGELRRLEGIGNKAFYEKNIGHHIHLIEINTGKIHDVFVDLDFLEIPNKFRVSSVDVKIYGVFEGDESEEFQKTLEFSRK